MNKKELHFDGVKLVSGIEKLAGAVKSTLGPSGQTVLIESPEHTHGITVTKDGVTVARAVNWTVLLVRRATELRPALFWLRLWSRAGFIWMMPTRRMCCAS
jgi:hypothetical protein